MTSEMSASIGSVDSLITHCMSLSYIICNLLLMAPNARLNDRFFAGKESSLGTVLTTRFTAPARGRRRRCSVALIVREGGRTLCHFGPCRVAWTQNAA